MKQMKETYQLHEKEGASYLTFPALAAYTELTHLFTTRWGGVSEGCCATWNFGAWDLDTEENIQKNYEILAQVLDVEPERMVRSYQTHTCNIRMVTADDGGKGVVRQRDYTEIDGLVTNVRGLALVTGHADCNAVFFFDPKKQVIGLVHSGWRGTLGGISEAMVKRMTVEYGSRPADIIAGIGPSLCQDCFEVDEDVAIAFLRQKEVYRHYMEKRGVKYHIDLNAIIRRDLTGCGLLEDHLLDMGLCTKCHPELFFSHRGQKGKRGIMAAAILLRE